VKDHAPVRHGVVDIQRQFSTVLVVQHVALTGGLLREPSAANTQLAIGAEIVGEKGADPARRQHISTRASITSTSTTAAGITATGIAAASSIALGVVAATERSRHA
jgi:hypothetical protein